MKLTIPALAAAMLLTVPAAMAQDAGAKPDFAAHWAAHRAQMCTNLYAHAVGKVAELEVKLKLTGAQKTAFEHWKTVKLGTIKARTDKCADAPLPDRNASITDLHKLQITRLEARLADLKAETPALDALVKTLDKDQLETLKRAGREARMMRKDMRGGRGFGPGFGPGGHHAPMMGAPMGAPMGGGKAD